MTEALSAKLFQLRDMHTASVREVSKVRPSDSIKDVARNWASTCGVRTIQGSGDKLRIVASLDDIAGGRRVWTQEFSACNRLLTMEDQITRAWWKPWR